MASRQKTVLRRPTREGVVLDSTVLGGTFTPSLSLGGGVVRNFFLQDRTQRQDLFALPPPQNSSNLRGCGHAVTWVSVIALSLERLPLPVGLPRRSFDIT